ncbi:MAG: DUF3048 domain-containing protein [Patescibacteria group bacterium]|nr:DUF3048 domain-containing protein [Patescibacteria group bacterium]
MKKKDKKVKLESQKEKYLTQAKKRKKLPLIVLAVVIVLAAVVSGFLLFGKETEINTNNTNQANEVGEVRRNIDGIYDSSENQNPYPVALMIENLVTVRPQSGLDKANLVYEALVEGGITRFMALYCLTEPVESMGPIRSARPYFLDWAKEYNALYGHVGGSPKAMSLISTYNIFNLDQFYDARYYWRDNERAAPHNVYTASKFLVFALRDKEAGQANYESYEYKEEIPLEDRPEEEKIITIDYSSYSYKVEWKYNRGENKYERFQGGEVFESKEAGQVKAKNVIVQYVKTSLEDESRLKMETIGQGEAMIFRDGLAIEAKWIKEGRNQRTKFYDLAGEEIKFNAGQTWIQIVPTDREVTF